MNLQLRGEALRFLLIGAVNTILTYALYLALLRVGGYTLAYTIAYVVGIVLAYVLNARFVFRVPRSFTNFVLFPLVYLVQYLLGVAALQVAVKVFAVPETFALIASIVATVPVTFVLSRLVLKRGARQATGECLP